ncbi:hypothetical protein MAPG_04941 [Magnaporthiopsis poae ATCC 64411]|uniref:SnoaL-like domain-containing protein n=1 Tax=Magnaporthiopsis poae (strain ATCC 64411 / 73-15) TaxID=644358 RepID=A0A0C4DY32_MAGP6|nr:hypothetical protein MAPG_04941 [Magnaporthiopsis poae ATCC 64411]
MTIEAIVRAFIDHINAGRWAEIVELIHGYGQVTYNNQRYPRDEFLSKLRELTLALPEGAFEIETVVSDETAQVVAVRIICRTTLPSDWEDKYWEDVVDGGVGMAARLAGIVSTADMAPSGATAAASPSDRDRRLTVLHHLFCWIKDGRVLDIKTIGDVEGVFRDENVAAMPPDLETDAALSTPAPKRLTAAELSATYRAYVDCINARTMDTDLARFCHPTVRHNGRDFSLAEYSGLMKDAQQAIEGLNFMIHTLLVDEDRQCLAVRLEFTGVPRKRWAGSVEPSGAPLEPGAFAEHVYYWLDGGRIARVLSLVDLASYRVQVRAAAGPQVQRRVS